MRWRARRSRVSLLFFVFMMLFVLSGYFLERTLAPTVIAVSQMRVTKLATEVIARAVYENLVQTTSYRELIYIERDEKGRIVFMQPDTNEVNRVLATSILAIQRALRDLSELEVKIPLGQAMGSVLFANYGPPIGVRVVPVGVAQVNLKDKFEDAGINTVRHMLYLESEVIIQVVIPLFSSEIRVVVNSPIAEAIIPGEVPQTYVKIGN